MPNALSVEPALRERTIALVGLMGVGKSSIGRRLASALDLPFRTPTPRSRRAAGRSIADIFAELRRGGLPRRRAAGDRPAAGRAAACAGHRRRRLLNAETRALIKARRRSRSGSRPTSRCWPRRVARRGHRPLLDRQGPARGAGRPRPRDRYPVYAEADIAVETGDAAAPGGRRRDPRRAARASAGGAPA